MQPDYFTLLKCTCFPNTAASYHSHFDDPVGDRRFSHWTLRNRSHVVDKTHFSPRPCVKTELFRFPAKSYRWGWVKLLSGDWTYRQKTLRTNCRDPHGAYIAPDGALIWCTRPLRAPPPTRVYVSSSTGGTSACPTNTLCLESSSTFILFYFLECSFMYLVYRNSTMKVN